MSSQPKHPALKGRQRGNAMVEYAVIASLLALCLFAASGPAGKMLTQAIQAFYSDLTFFFSLP
jgi:Flp pilus assembly pilin Flp